MLAWGVRHALDACLLSSGIRHLLCPSCRGQYCSRDVTCDTCRTWTDAQWIAFDARRAYKRRGGSTPVLGGGLVKVVAGAVEGDRALVPLPQQPPHALVPWGTFDVGTGAGAPSGSSFPATTTTPSTSVASTPHFYYGGFPSTTLPSHCHPPVMMSAAPVSSSVPFPSTSSHPQPIIQFPPSPSTSVVPSGVPEYRRPPPPSSFPWGNVNLNFHEFPVQHQHQQQQQAWPVGPNHPWGPPPPPWHHTPANPVSVALPPPPPPVTTAPFPYLESASRESAVVGSNLEQVSASREGERSLAVSVANAPSLNEAAFPSPVELGSGPSSLSSSGFSGFEPPTREGGGEPGLVANVPLRPPLPLQVETHPVQALGRRKTRTVKQRRSCS